MAAPKNGRWVWVGIVGSAVAVLSCTAAFVGIPSCNELQTKTLAEKQHTAIVEKTSHMTKAAARLNKSEHETFRKGIERNAQRQEQSDKRQEERMDEIRKMLWQITREVKR